jgi:SAM-dependent methyltransferase
MARSRGLGDVYKRQDIEMDLNLHYEPYGTYDLVFCLEVFDYVYDPMQAFKTIANQLANGGVAWVTFPSVYPLHQPVEDDALRYMPGGIKKLAAAVGLTIEEMIPRRFESDAWDRTIRAERLRAAKHQDHNFSGWIVKFKK